MARPAPSLFPWVPTVPSRRGAGPSLRCPWVLSTGRDVEASTLVAPQCPTFTAGAGATGRSHRLRVGHLTQSLVWDSPLGCSHTHLPAAPAELDALPTQRGLLNALPGI